MSTNLPRSAPPRPQVSTDRYTRLPDALLGALSPREHQLVHLLLSYRWTPDAPIYPLVRTMAGRLDWSPRTVQRTLRSLEGRGYLVTTPEYRESDGGQTSNRYTPGPLLLALLAPVDAAHGARPDRPSHPPVTGGAYRKTDVNYSKGNRRPESRIPTDPNAYLLGPYGAVVRR